MGFLQEYAGLSKKELKKYKRLEKQGYFRTLAMAKVKGRI
jgi:hypothetical protein